MPSRQSRKRSRAQQRRRKQSMKGGRRGDEEKPKEEENPNEEKKEEENEEKKEEEKDTGILGGIFGSDKKEPDAPTETPTTDAPAEDKPKDEGGMFSGLMGKKEEETPAAEKKGKKGKRGKKGKYYTTKQLKKACARLAHNKRVRSKKRQRTYVAPPFQGNGAFEQNPYEFGPRM